MGKTRASLLVLLQLFICLKPLVHFVFASLHSILSLYDLTKLESCMKSDNFSFFQPR